MAIKKIITLFLTTIILVVNSSFNNPEQTDEQEYILKAAFLYRFIDYIGWRNNNEGNNFAIAVLGESGITKPLLEIASEKTVGGKNMDVKEYDNIGDITSCQILFVSRNYKAGLETVISKFDDKPILIITEQKDACEKGADINFVIAENKLKFEINLKAANKANLRISSQLLQHAILVTTL